VTGVAVVFNPSKISLSRLQESLAKNSLSEISIFASDPETNGIVATQEAIALGAKLILVVGGDGTLRGVTQAIVDSDLDIVVGLIPLGTGNVLARNLKLSLGNIDKAIKRALTGNPYRIDLGVARSVGPDGSIKTQYFTGIAGLGMDARIMQRTQTELKRKVGWIAYIDGGIRSLPLKFEKFEFAADEQPIRTLKSYTILVGNAGWLPGQLSMMPDARLDDGRLDVAAIGPRRLFNWVDFFSRITWQNRVVRPLALGRKWMDETANLKTMENLNGSRIRIKPHNPTPMQLDGDVVGEVVEVDFSVKPQGLAISL
jgi:diacylglycerol kinase (ATP)